MNDDLTYWSVGASVSLVCGVYFWWRDRTRKRQFIEEVAIPPDVKINDCPGKRYDGIQIRSYGFSGLIDWSPSQEFGFATGRGENFTVQMGIYLLSGKPRWTVGYRQADDVWLCDEGWGVFLGELADRPGWGMQLFNNQGMQGFAALEDGNWWGKLTGISVENGNVVVATERDPVIFTGVVEANK